VSSLDDPYKERNSQSKGRNERVNVKSNSVCVEVNLVDASCCG
jgi:hypothetical protein